MNADGKRVRRLTKHPQYDAGPVWSPDGQKITFMSFRDEHRIQVGGIILGEIYVMNTDGTNPINISQKPDDWDLSPSWGPAPALYVASQEKLATLWGKVKRAR